MTSLKIVAVAIQHDGMIYSMPRPARHHHVLNKLTQDIMPNVLIQPDEQGFLDSNGKFRSRQAALLIAVNAGQCEGSKHGGPHLYSEDLW